MLSESECKSLSPDGRYLASTTEDAQRLKIFYFPSMKLIYQQDWDEDWESCFIFWESSDILVFIDVISGLRLYFKFENLSLNEIDNPNAISYSSLPNFFPSILNNLYIQSPANPDIYLYERCSSGQIVYELFCKNGTEIVIYNSLTNQDIAIPRNADSDYMRGYYVDTSKPANKAYISESLASWSPDGRYLAYFDFINPIFPSDGKIMIYDLQLDRYLNDEQTSESGLLFRPNVWRKLEWSDENILVIWKTGGSSDEFSYRPHDSLNHFVFVHADDEVYTQSQEVFDSWRANIRQNVIFSPDSRAIAIIGQQRLPLQEPPDLGTPRRGNLILIDTTTGESTIIDTDVTEIITWRSICDFTPLDTASLISTMQTEPYSVICLAENGQYDLTAPLPDVAGDITIIGNGATINMTAQDRVFNVVYNQQWSRNGTLTLKNLTIVSENAEQGGAIANTGELNLEDVSFENGE